MYTIFSHTHVWKLPYSWCVWRFSYQYASSMQIFGKSLCRVTMPLLFRDCDASRAVGPVRKSGLRRDILQRWVAGLIAWCTRIAETVVRKRRVYKIISPPNIKHPLGNHGLEGEVAPHWDHLSQLRMCGILAWNLVCRRPRAVLPLVDKAVECEHHPQNRRQEQFLWLRLCLYTIPTW